MSGIDALMEQGRAAVEAGEFEVARQIYEHCLELDADNLKVQIRYGKVLLSLKRYAAALAIGLQVIEGTKSREWGYTLAGKCYYHLGQLLDAEQMFRQAVAIKPYPWTWSFLYQVLLITDRKAEGMDCLREALKLDPNYEEAYYNLGCCYNSQQQYELAEMHLRRAIEIDPDYALAHAELGAMLSTPAYFAFKEIKQAENVYAREAKSNLLRAIELDPSNGWPRLYLANLLWRMGKDNAAEEQYQAPLELWPQHSIAYWCYGDFLSATDRDHAKAGQLLRKAVELEPDDATAHYHLGKHLLRCKHKFKARQALMQAAELGHEKAVALLEEIKSSK